MSDIVEEEDSSEEEQSPVEQSYGQSLYSYLQIYEEEILRCEEEIDLALSENLHRVEQMPYHETLSSVISRILRSEVEEDVDNLARTFLVFIQRFDEINISNLETADQNDGFLKFVSLLNIKYEAEIRCSRLRESQGNQFWSGITSDIVIRDVSGRVGLNHSIYRGREVNTTISTDLSSTLYLVNHFLQKELEAIEIHEEKAITGIHQSRIDQIIENAEELKRLLETGEQSSLEDFEDD